MSSKKKNKSKKNKSAPKDFDALKIPENNGDVEALITATNAGDIQWGRAASQKLPGVTWGRGADDLAVDVNGTRLSSMSYVH